MTLTSCSVNILFQKEIKLIFISVTSYPNVKSTHLFHVSSIIARPPPVVLRGIIRSGSIFRERLQWPNSIFRRDCVLADPPAPSAALPRLHGNTAKWTEEESTQIRPRWSNGWCWSERESARGSTCVVPRRCGLMQWIIVFSDGRRRGTKRKLIF